MLDRAAELCRQLHPIRRWVRMHNEPPEEVPCRDCRESVAILDKIDHPPDPHYHHFAGLPCNCDYPPDPPTVEDMHPDAVATRKWMRDHSPPDPPPVTHAPFSDMPYSVELVLRQEVEGFLRSFPHVQNPVSMAGALVAEVIAPMWPESEPDAAWKDAAVTGRLRPVQPPDLSEKVEAALGKYVSGAMLQEAAQAVVARLYGDTT